jgi:predicted dehydrogenase
MARNWRVAVIGRTGKGGYGHGLDIVWQQFENVEIVAVADEDDSGRAAVAKKLNAKHAYKDFRQMLAREKPQIVSIGDRWLDAHRDMVLACAEHGANIFLEKPMCRTLAEADEMIAACEKHHVKLAIAHQTRYSPRIDRVKELIGEGKLGEILEMRGRGKEDSRGGGQDLMVLGTHIMDLMRYLAGDAGSCHSRIWQGDKPAVAGDIREGGEGMGPILGDRIHAEYTFAHGIVGTFDTHKAKFGAGKRFS